MNNTASTLSRLYLRAQKQYGVLRREQILEIVAERTFYRLLSNDLLERSLPGVYRLATYPPSWEGELLAAVFWAGEGAVASNRSAAARWGLTGFEEGPIEITLGRSREPRGSIRIFHRELPEHHITRFGPLPITRVERTIFDLASNLDERELGRVLDDALRSGKVTPGRIRSVFRELAGPGRQGTEVMRRVLTARDDSVAPTDSELEDLLLGLIKKAGLPLPVLQYEVRSGGRRFYIDLAYPERRLAIEVQGYAYHSALERFEDDRVRHNLLQNLGWRILYFTWDDVVNHPQRTVAALRRGLSEHAGPEFGALPG